MLSLIQVEKCDVRSAKTSRKIEPILIDSKTPQLEPLFLLRINHYSIIFYRIVTTEIK